MKIKVLSVGIDHYAHPQITNLRAAVADAQKIKSFFTSTLQISAANFCQLYNDEATREAIIGKFRSHFQNLQPGDVAVFYYSGHGSTEPCSEAFVQVGLDNAGGQNEALVCYDSRINGTRNIADKELRLLISEVQRDSDGNHISGIHFVCIFDCCHSGSMLRDAKNPIRIRLDQCNNTERNLGEYLEGQYQIMGKLHIPRADFILLAACSPDQSALENNNGGYFTTALIDFLEYSHKTNHYHSYAAFYSVLRETIFQETQHEQTPHLEYAGKVDPYDTFLQLQGKALATYPAIVRHNNQLKVNLGAIHGIVYEDVQEQEIPIYHISDLKTSVGTCRVRRVELEHTLIHNFEPEHQQRTILTDELNDQTINQYFKELRVGLCGNSLPLEIRGSSESSAVKNLVEQLRHNRFVLKNNKAKYHLLLDKENVTLEGVNHEQILGFKNYTPACTNVLTHLLFQINKWENIKTLTNTKSTRVNPDKMTLSFEYTNYEGVKLKFSNSSVVDDERPVIVEYDPDRSPLTYFIKFSHTNIRKLYCYLVHLDRTFGMKQKHENFNKYLVKNEEVCMYDSFADGNGLGIRNPNIDEIEDTFVLIAAKDPLSIPHSLQQQGLEQLYGMTIDGKEIAGGERSGQTKDPPLDNLNEVEWAIRKITVRTVRKKS
ncbi:MAG: caspase family protein [Bacteroidota bacterium]